MLKFFQNFGVCCAEVDYILGQSLQREKVGSDCNMLPKLTKVTSLANIDCTDLLKLLRF